MGMVKDPGSIVPPMMPASLMTMIHNPYIGIRGRGISGGLNRTNPPHQSMEALRNLLHVVPTDMEDEYGRSTNGNNHDNTRPPSRSFRYFDMDEKGVGDHHANDGSDTGRHSTMTPPSTSRFGVATRWPFLFPSSTAAAAVDVVVNTEKQRSRDDDYVDEYDDNLPPSLRPNRLHQQPQSPYPRTPVSPDETASHLAEGILRAYRDLALDEAVELHLALRYWTNRWERPLMSWLEAGPMVWSGGGYNHQAVGETVARIQAVLVRRLSTIGELQQHLLRAGWQRGVAQWGFLGGGGEWAAVAGTDGRMTKSRAGPGSGLQNRLGPSLLEDDLPQPAGFHRQNSESAMAMLHPPHVSSSGSTIAPAVGSSSDLQIVTGGFVPNNKKKKQKQKRKRKVSKRSRRHNELYYTNLFVKMKDGGRISKDDSALAQWSVDAMALVRREMHRASMGQITLPYSDNWSEVHVSASEGGANDPASSSNTLPAVVPAALPAWASVALAPLRRASYSALMEDDLVSTDDDDDDDDDHDEAVVVEEEEEDGDDEEGYQNGLGDESESDIEGKATQKNNMMLRTKHRMQHSRSYGNRLSTVGHQNKRGDRPKPQKVTICDLNLLVNEVSGILDVMEDVIDVQRGRRLDKLKPPSWYRQYWFVSALVAPSVVYVVYKLAIKRDGWNLLKYASQKILNFFDEHVVRPCFAIYHELTKGTESISDRAARDTAIITLKQMILSWLDENYPEMSESQKWDVADKMDISLIEAMKERNMKTIYELNSVIRMSFIEAQFIKKEMMNALVALDDMQASTNFNMNLAAITPFVLLMWTAKRVFSYVVYTTFKWGKSREETYASIFRCVTEMERLLIMRNNPPSPPVRHHGDSLLDTSSCGTAPAGDSVLDSDDLGMLMLHIHEIRTILWDERRRFSNNVLRSVSEDLAELSGERGALSVRQQLLIVERMNRSYTFMRPTSSSSYSTG